MRDNIQPIHLEKFIRLLKEPVSEDVNNDTYWQSFRNQAAKDILCAVLPGIEVVDGDIQQSIENTIGNSIVLVDEFIRRLKEKKEE